MTNIEVEIELSLGDHYDPLDDDSITNHFQFIRTIVVVIDQH